MTKQDNVFARSEATKQPQSQHQYHEDEIDLVDYIKVAYKYRWMIIAIVLISTFLTGVFSFMKPKMYEAQATFFPLSTEYGIQSQSFVMKPRLNIEDLIISMLESRKMADRIIEQLNLKDTWNQNILAYARKSLDGATKISLDKNGIIKLSVCTKSPELSAKIANSYVDNLDYFNRELNLGANTKIVQVIDRAIMPEERMPRGTIKKTAKSGTMFLVIAIFAAFLIEFIKKSDIRKKLQEK